MNWIFIVVRDNNVEKVKTFTDFWEGTAYTDDFIRHIDDNFANGSVAFPAYNRNEFYKHNDLTVGLYKGC
jgi:hypothetical protein